LPSQLSGKDYDEIRLLQMADHCRCFTLESVRNDSKQPAL